MTPSLLALGIGLSVLMGTLGGLYPAWRAARLIPWTPSGWDRIDDGTFHRGFPMIEVVDVSQIVPERQPVGATRCEGSVARSIEGGSRSSWARAGRARARCSI